MEKTDPDIPKDQRYNTIKYRENRLKNHFGYFVHPYPEDLLNMMGYMNMNMGQQEKANMFFEHGIEYFPQSPNAFDSMADYYAVQKDFSNALK